MRKLLSVFLSLILCASLALPALAAFTDVPEDAYYAKAVAWAVENGVTNGATATTFDPDKTCTRAEIITFLWRAAGKPAPTERNPYSDVPEGEYYTDAIRWAAEKLIAEAGETFSPDAPCTRAMAVTFLWKNAHRPWVDSVPAFKDVPENAAYAQAVAWAVDLGITTGATTTTFAPDETCTRGQIVTFLYRAMGGTPEFQKMLAEADALRESILNDTSSPEISGTVYYVSNSGSDTNNGLTPETAWATLDKVASAPLKRGDGVLFERGSVFRAPDQFDRNLFLECMPGVTYAAYGTGPKPVIMGSPENGADPEKWSLYGETPDGGKVWRYHRDMRDCGTIVLNGGDVWTKKVRPNWGGDGFVNADGTPFDVLAGLSRDLMFFSPADSLLRQKPTAGDQWVAGKTYSIVLAEEMYRHTKGALYLRCDEGNPGEVFNSIEFSVTPSGAGSPLVGLAGGVVFDNIHVTLGSDCGFMSGGDGEEPRTVQNCEVSFCGGGILCYNADGQSEAAGDGFNTQNLPHTITHCYVHDNGDNGITIEWGDSKGDLTIHDLIITGNLFQRNFSDIQMKWFDEVEKDYKIVFKNFTITDNYMLDCSGGWSGDFHHWDGGSCLVYGDYSTPLNGENILIHNNTLYSPTSGAMISGGCIGFEPPQLKNNRIFMPPLLSPKNPCQYDVAVISWANEHATPERHDEWLIYYDFDCEEFLNGFLGSGNTVHIIR